ncbi:MAG: HisA/HisF-related TIM barrel protein [Acidimicrobiia bacterium]
MDLYARVNILGGRAVRLPRGKVSDAISLDADPIGRAAGWVAKGAHRLHIVDLDGAAYGDYQNRPLIHDLIEAVDVPVQVAGGVRSPREVDALLSAGAWRVVMGTAAIEHQIMVWDLCREHPGRIVVSLDVGEDGEIATRGWTENSGRHLEEVLIEMSSAGAAAFAIAEVGRDALEEPPDLDAMKEALSIVDEPVIAAGGVRNLDDLRSVLALDAAGRRVDGIILGREVTAGRFTFEQAAALVGEGGTLAGGPWTSGDILSALDGYQEALLAAGEVDVSDLIEQATRFLEFLERGELKG